MANVFDGRWLLLRRAILLYGPDKQWDQVIEECGELITAILHRRRERATTAQVAEEVADVLIMAQQARKMTDPALVDLYIKKKLDRLEQRVTAGEEKRKEGLEPGPNDTQEDP